MTDQRLRLTAEFQNNASSGVKKLAKDLDAVKPTNGMAAAQRWFSEFRGTTEKTVGALRPVSGMLGAVGLGSIAAGFSIGEMIKQFRDLADSTATLKELGRQSGISATDLARLQYVAQRLHVDPAQMSGAIDAFSGQMVEFKRHTGEFYAELLRQNGDVAAKIAADNPIDALKDTIEFLSKIKNPQVQKYWAGMAGLGDILPIIGKSAQDRANAYKEAAESVPPVTDAMIAEAEALNASIAKFDQSWKSFKTEVGPTVFDELKKGADDFRAAFDSVKGARNWLAEHKDHPVRDLLSAADEANDAKAKEVGGRLKGETPWGLGIPKPWKDELGLSDPNKPDDGSYSFTWREMWAAMVGGGKAAPGPVTNFDGNALRRNDEMPSASSKWSLPAATNFDGNALHRNDEMPTSVLSRELFKSTEAGSKAGTIAAWREIMQQQNLTRDEDGGRGPGAPSLRRGRGPDGVYRRSPHGGGYKFIPPTPDGAGHPDAVKGSTGMRALSAMKYLVEKKGWTPEGAAIAVGNAMRESSVTPNGQPGDPNTPGGSHYMFQWNNGRTNDTVHGRRATFERWAKDNSRTVNDPEANLDFMDEERKHRSGLEAEWDKQRDLRNAGRLGHAFEGYGDNSEGTRVQNARDMMAVWKKLHPETAHATGGPIRGSGGPRSDSIFAMLSNGEFVVNAHDAARHAGLLHAINSGGLPAFADGGPVADGKARRASWLDFFRRPLKDGGMGAPRHVAYGGTAMMNGESGWRLNPALYGYDVNGPSGGTAQWHDVIKGSGAGKVHRLSDLMAMAMAQHADWTDVPLQQAWWKHEALGPMRHAWSAMRRAKTAAGALRAGIDDFEVPANKTLEFHKRLPNIMRLAREQAPGSAAPVIDPVEIHIRHHANGRTSVQATAGKGVTLGIRTNPVMRQI